MEEAKALRPRVPGYSSNPQQQWMTNTTVPFVPIVLFAVILRLCSRRLKKQSLWWDDWVIIFSTVWFLATTGLIYSLYSVGLGVHADQLTLDDLINISKRTLGVEILYVFSITWTKVGILLMYYRIFRIPFFKNMVWIISIFVICWATCAALLFSFYCIPFAKQWDPTLPGHCFDAIYISIANAASTVFTDVVILLLPIHSVWRLQMKTSVKLLVTLSFGLGLCTVFISSYRIPIFLTYSSADASYTLTALLVWGIIEMAVAIISACLPTLLPLVKFIGERIGLLCLAVNNSRTSTWNKVSDDCELQATTVASKDRIENQR